MKRHRIVGTYGPWPWGVGLSRATVRHVGRGRPQGQRARRAPDNARTFNATRRAALARARTEPPRDRSFREKARAFTGRIFGRRKV